MERKHWIDLLRGICMMAILLDHTELYYTGINVIDYNAYVVNALVLFFILSGYLMFQEDGFNLQKKLKSITKGLLLPYFLFSALLSVPKSIIHADGTTPTDIVLQILAGQSSWFVAALCLSEIIFSLAIWITRRKTYVLFLIGILGFLLSIYLSQGKQPYIWQLDNSMQALLFLSTGYTYHRYEKVFNSFTRPLYTSLLFILLIILKVYESKNGVNMLIWYIHINNYPIFLLDITISFLFMIGFCKALSSPKVLLSRKGIPSRQWIEWTGSHSLVYYFLCGGVPLFVSKLFSQMGMEYDGNYLYVLAAFILVYVITTLMTWVVYKYLPFLVGKWYKKRYN